MPSQHFEAVSPAAAATNMNKDPSKLVGKEEIENSQLDEELGVTKTRDVQEGDQHQLQAIDSILDGADGRTYRTMGRWDALFALLCTQFGLGVLGIPGAMRDLGVIPGIIAIVGIGVVSGYAGLELLQFFARYPHCVNIIDMVEVVGGRPWQVVAAVGLVIQLLTTCASTAVTLSVALNSLTEHVMCTVGFIGIACIACFILCVPRTVKFVAHSGYPTFASILLAALIVMISLGVSGPPNVPEDWTADIKLFASPSFRQVFNACLRIIYAFAGNITFVTYMAEMRHPVRDFPWALGGLISISIGLYLILAITIYCLAAEYTTSPALGSAPIIPAKIAYGIVIPAVMTAGLSNGHVGIKYVFIQFLRWRGKVEHITSNSLYSWAAWLGCAAAFWVSSFIISNVIPIFDSILSISSATTYAWFTYGIAAILWFHINKGRYFKTPLQILLTVVHICLVVFSFFLNGGGLWASITELIGFFDSGDGVRGVFDCGDNSIL